MNEIQLLAKIKNEIKNHFTFNTANKSLIEIIDDTAIISNSVSKAELVHMIPYDSVR